MIGTTTALIIGGLAAGGQVAGAAIAGKAAKSAAKEQQAGADQAAAELRGERERFSTAFAPYRQAADSAIMRLSDSITRRRGQSTGATSATQTVPLKTSVQGRLAQPRTGSGHPSWAATVPLARGVERARGQVVAVQSPDGEVRYMDPARADLAVQRGAQLVA